MNVLDAILKDFDATLVALTLMATLVVWVVYTWHHKKAGFDLSQVLVDGVTGRIAIEKVGYMTALAISSWGFVALIVQGKMSEWYAGLYIGVFAAARFGSSYLSVKKDLANVPAEPKP